MQKLHTRLLVTRFAECVRFYRDILGLTLQWGDENSGYASFKGGSGGEPLLALFQRQEMSAAVGTSDLPLDAASQDKVMLIFSVDDVDAEVEGIRKLGWQIEHEPRNFPEWGYRGAYLRDPDGTLIELLTGLPAEAWTDDLKEANEKYHP